MSSIRGPTVGPLLALVFLTSSDGAAAFRPQLPVLAFPNAGGRTSPTWLRGAGSAILTEESSDDGDGDLQAAAADNMSTCWQWRDPPRPWGKDWGKRLDQFTPETENETFWTELPPRQPPLGGPKLALLMFVKDQVFNAEVWLAWMESARVANLSFNLHIHAYGDPKLIRPEFRNFTVHEFVETSWCMMAEAEMVLMRHALQDPSVTHLATVSADSIPVKPLSFMYQELAREPSTRMCVDLDSWEDNRRTHAETWWVMHRGQAELFHENWKLVSSSFERRCTEEKTWLLPLLLRSGRWGDKEPLQDECVMFTDWSGTCSHWADHAALCSCPNLQASPANKATEADPATFKHAGPEVWAELLRSPFWFARKFQEGALKVSPGRAWGPDMISA